MQSTRQVAPSPGGHGHGHGPVPPVSRRTRRVVAAVLIPAAVATVVALIALWPPRPEPTAVAGPSGERVSAVVTSVDEQACPPPEPGSEQPDGWRQRCGSATAMLTSGPERGQSATFNLPQGGPVTLHVDDDVVLDRGADVGSGRATYTFADHRRSTAMFWLAGLAIVAILAFGRWRGLASLVGLAISFAVLVLFVIPAILDGAPPLLTAVVGAAAIMFAALYLTHGVNVHTSIAVAGTLASLVLTGLLGTAFTGAMHMTGIGGEDTSYLSTTLSGIDLRGLLLAAS